MSIDAALASTGTQFVPDAVEALETLARCGELTPAATRLHQPTA
jgi:hypothetical protein